MNDIVKKKKLVEQNQNRYHNKQKRLRNATNIECLSKSAESFHFICPPKQCEMQRNSYISIAIQTHDLSIEIIQIAVLKLNHVQTLQMLSSQLQFTCFIQLKHYNTAPYHYAIEYRICLYIQSFIVNTIGSFEDTQQEQNRMFFLSVSLFLEACSHFGHN